VTAARIVLAVLFPFLLSTSPVIADVVQYSDDFSGATLNAFWEENVQIPGATITQAGGVLTIDSPTAPSGFLDAGVISTAPLPLGDFTASVDFLVPQGSVMAWLHASQSPTSDPDAHLFGAYLWDLSEYNVWYRNDGFSGSKFGRNAFGDEDTTWHRLELSYDALTTTMSAYVDDIFLKSGSVVLDNFVVTLKMKDSNTYGRGPSSVQFDNFQFSYSSVPEPSSLILVVTCAGSLFGIARLRARKRKRPHFSS